LKLKGTEVGVDLVRLLGRPVETVFDEIGEVFAEEGVDFVAGDGTAVGGESYHETDFRVSFRAIKTTDDDAATV
jgi:hypothetical protein